MQTKTQKTVPQHSVIRVIGTSDDLDIGILEQVGKEDFQDLIEVSESLADKFGDSARLNPGTIKKYFNYPQTYPFIARLNGRIIGYIIGVPLERFATDTWAQHDKNLGKKNTIYTYAFAVKKQFHKTGYAKMLKRIYYNWMRKREVEYISGHVVDGTTSRFNGEAEVIKTFDNWHGTGLTFEYYRRSIQTNGQAG
ncbi:MAG: GNAT family N-acetyltransferase [Candidatus Marinimicrobia bacterium]|nr:GNAT family N-acetyltransferase [Candidatus Neomarinimicrobiota bacterium]MCF7828550.1 GNAT family N-acetyltransferase [Candidatus Neomarinimicrobiota bacterium]MCF7882027.1 GNAT family N-acetyltransferase [Candidatus Neomarinimicrobiota bacterium]